MSLVSLCGGPHTCEGRDVHQIVSDDAEADPSMHTVDAMVATAAQAVPTFEHTDAAVAPDAPALPAAEPALTFVGATRRRLGTPPRQDHASYAAVNCRLLEPEAVVLGALRSLFATTPGGVDISAWRERCEKVEGVKRRTFFDAKAKLMKAGRIVEPANGKFAPA
jgi:hypothetical protein